MAKFTKKLLRDKTAKAVQKSSPTPRSIEPGAPNNLMLLQSTLGNRATGRFMQAKLRVNRPGDRYEQEADRVAEQVMRMPASEIQRQPKDEEELHRAPLKEDKEELQRQLEEDDDALQAKTEGSGTLEVSDRVQSNIDNLRSGQPLPESTRAFFEPRFRRDFSNVRVHIDSQAAEAARAVNAKAFTTGQDVVFGAGQLAPGNPDGQKLLAHELTHVVQQSGRVSSGLQRQLGKVSKLIQRAAAAASPDPIKQQWEDDWNNPAFSAAQKRFKGGDRPKGTPKERYDILCPLYQKHGISRPLEYVQNNITTVSFYGFKTPAHSDMKSALAAAESTLKTKGYSEAPIEKAWAFNARTRSDGGWSNHSLGRAIDLDDETNPHLTNRRERKIISALSGYDIEKRNPGEDEGLDIYDAAKAASEKFQERYNPAGMRDRIMELQNEEKNIKDELNTLKNTLKETPKGKKASREDRKKAEELKKEIKKKEAEIKQLAKRRKLFEDDLKGFEKLDTTIDVLAGEVTTQQQNIDLLEAKLSEVTDKKVHSKLEKELKKKRDNLKKAEKKLAKKEKERAEQNLRRFADTGFLNLSKDLVEAMKTAGFNWGGEWEGAKDFMHFELP